MTRSTPKASERAFAQVRPIKTEADHEAALAEIARLMDASPDSSDGDRLDVLVTLVERYEEAHWPIGLPHPLDAIRFALEQRGLTRKDLESLIGSRGRVSEILSGKRPLTLNMIRKLNKELGIPAEVLIQDYEAARPRAKQEA